MAFLFSSSLQGIHAERVTVEATIAPGIPSFVIVGLPDTAIQEARERIRSALRTLGMPLPQCRVTVNLAPGNLKKIGSAFDLPIAMAILLASGNVVPKQTCQRLFLGELSLTGELCAVNGVLASVLLAQKMGDVEVYVPFANRDEAVLVDGVKVYAAQTLREIVAHVTGIDPLPLLEYRFPDSVLSSSTASAPDFSSIQGQLHAKRALEIAAAGGHNVLLSGPPGSGKSLLAKAFASILPPMTQEEMLEVTCMYSCLGLVGHGTAALIQQRPFRAPHHSISHVALVGGGMIPRPGEVSLAHHGVLFLDEMPEFSRFALEHLRQPLEDRAVTLSRAHGTVHYPAHFSLIATQNPCPCGFASDPDRHCTCSAAALQRYKQKVSGPLLDRIDLRIEVPRVPTTDYFVGALQEYSEDIRKRVVFARTVQHARLHGHTPYTTNAAIPHEKLRAFVRCTPQAQALIERAATGFKLSARAISRILKVGRTIADLDHMPEIEERHIAEALQFRLPEKLTA